MISLKILDDDFFLWYEIDSEWSDTIEVSEEFAKRFRDNWQEFMLIQDGLSAIRKKQNGKQK